MAAEMNDVINLTKETESGDVVNLLSQMAGLPNDEIEKMLRTGMTPWELARKLQVLDQLRDALLERMFAQLREMVEDRRMTQQAADEIIANYEMNVPFVESNTM